MAPKKLTKLSQLKHDPKNANRGTDRGRQVVEDSVSNLGTGRSILVDKTGVVMAGNKTMAAARKAGIQNIRVVETDGTELIVVQRTDLNLATDEKAKRLAVADNRASELGLEWDPAILQAIDAELDLAEMFSKEEMAAVLRDLETPTLQGDVDDVPETPTKAKTKDGMLYALGNHRLMCGDSTVAHDVDKLMCGKPAAMVFTDPPYGVEFQSGMSKGGTATRFDRLANDDKILHIADIVAGQMADDSAAFIWTSHQVYPTWRQQFATWYKHTVIWYKHGGGIGDLEGSYATDYEMALFCVKGRPTFRGNRGMAVWDVAKDGALAYLHPTQKPVALADKAIRDFTDAGDLILDLFGGSGSTLIACETSGRHARLMELDPKYCDVIVNRWEQLTGKKAEVLK